MNSSDNIAQLCTGYYKTNMYENPIGILLNPIGCLLRIYNAFMLSANMSFLFLEVTVVLQSHLNPFYLQIWIILHKNTFLKIHLVFKYTHASFLKF